MYDQARLGLSLLDRVEDPVKGDLNRVELTQAEAQREECSGQLSWNGNSLTAKLGGVEPVLRHEDRTIVPTDTRAVRQEGGAVRDVSNGVGRNGRRLESAFHPPAVQGLDPFKEVLEPKPAGVQSLLGEGVEHERIVRVRTVSDPDEPRLHHRSLSSPGRPGSRESVFECR